MREFKFRVFVIKAPKHYVGLNDGYMLTAEKSYEVIGLDGTVWDMVAATEIYGELNDCVLMQYTGLKDKNGKEIYEGDIVSWNSDKLGKVVWNDLLAYFAIDCDYYPSYRNLGSFCGVVQVIGNIYENPELLEERS